MIELMPALGKTVAEEELIRAAVQGDRPAFGELYQRYARMVHGILLARVPAGDAEDLVQDVFMSAMKQLRNLRTAAAFRGWLATIARHRAIDYFREAHEQSEFNEKDAPAQSGEAEAFAVLDLIRTLPEAYRETLVLRLVEGMTGPEIARQTGLTPDSVRVNLCRGMKMLRELLGDGERK
jgi:RNA polymerase sigma-70 factor (ECF subfamily)